MPVLARGLICIPALVQLLPLLLGKLGDPGLPSEQVFHCLTKMVQLMAEHTRREHSNPVWTALLVCGMAMPLSPD